MENKQLYLNYKTYLDTEYHFNKKNIQTIVFNFNNRARLIKPQFIENSTVTINNTQINKIFFKVLGV
jgi:hypothetical protein